MLYSIIYNLCNIFVDDSKEKIETSSDEEFYTPPGSPSLLVSDDEFDETRLPYDDVFIEG